MKKHQGCPGPWCNCDECRRWRGGRYVFDPPLQESHLKALARLRAAAAHEGHDLRVCLCDGCRARRATPFIMGVDFASGPDQSVERPNAPMPTWEQLCAEMNQQLADDIDRALGIPLDHPPRVRITREEVDQAISSIFPKGSRAGLPPVWTSDDLDFLRALKIAPWK